MPSSFDARALPGAAFWPVSRLSTEEGGAAGVDLAGLRLAGLVLAAWQRKRAAQLARCTAPRCGDMLDFA